MIGGSPDNAGLNAQEAMDSTAYRVPPSERIALCEMLYLWHSRAST